MSRPAESEGYERVENVPSPTWDWGGHALVHQTSLVHRGVNLFGPVLIGPHCEIGPNASIFGPTVVEGRSYLGPSVEVRRCLLLAGAEISLTSSFVGPLCDRSGCLAQCFRLFRHEEPEARDRTRGGVEGPWSTPANGGWAASSPTAWRPASAPRLCRRTSCHRGNHDAAQCAHLKKSSSR